MAKSTPTILNYSAPPAKTRWWEWLVLGSFSFLILAIEALAPRLSPSRWPTEEDYLAMLMLPVGAIVISLTTKLPHRCLLYYGFFGAVLIRLPQYPYVFVRAFDDPDMMLHLLVNWTIYVFAFTLFCWATVFLRLLINRRSRRPTGS